jgi:hypothetical protein
MDRTPLENQIFSWDNWNETGPMSMQFMNVELKVRIGEFAAGTKFPFAFILGESSLLLLIDEKNEQHYFALNLTVGERVESPEHEHGDFCEDDVLS